MTGFEQVAVLVGGLGGLGGVAALIDVLARRAKARADATQTRADAAQAITDTAMTWINEFEEDAKAARTELQAVREEARQLADELHTLRMAIMDPNATVEGLRTLVRASNAQQVADPPPTHS